MSELTSKARILVADDSKTERLILQSLLKQQGYPVYVASDGRECIEVYKDVKPDIVLLDAIMPNVDGYEAAEAIRHLPGGEIVPIIFITSLTDAESLARCLEVGGNDFLTKPFNYLILKAKIESYERMLHLYQTVTEQRDKISRYHDDLISEQIMARKIFDNIAHKGCLNANNIEYNLSPMSIFNGDIMLAAEKPAGGMHIFLGDFTGHGLPAAIGSMPVSEIFYGMTIKGFALAEMLKEINFRLNRILPKGVFCCAIAIEFDYHTHNCKIWNGGLPEAYLLEQSKGIIETFKSKHLALGILPAQNFSTVMQSFILKEKQQLFIATDGIIEAESTDEMFGEERLKKTLLNAVKSRSNILSTLREELNNFTGLYSQSDDISYLVVSGEHPEIEQTIEEQSRSSQPLSFSINYQLKAQTLKNFDPLPLVLQPIMEVNAMRVIRSKVFTILSELYNNALEHGVLGLESISKTDAENFAEYYLQKQQKLEQLDEAQITIKVDLENIMNKGFLRLTITDSGEGFNFKKIMENKKDQQLHGRGLSLLTELCDKITYLGNGSEVEIELNW